jgi:hypothetical protein
VLNANYSMLSTPFGRDVTGELLTAFRAKGMRGGVYVCPSLWNNDNYFYPDSLTSFGNCCSPNYNPSDPTMAPVWSRFVDYLHGIISEINTNYKPDHWWRDSPQKDLWSPDAEESRNKNGLMRSEMSGYSGHRISEELDGLKLPDLRRESSSSSRISLVSSPIAPLLAEGSQNVVMIRSTGAVMVISRDEPTMYVSSYAKPFSLIKSSTLNINAAESLDKLLPFPCIRFGFQDLGAPLFGRAESGIQALGYPSAFSANSEARRLLNLGDDPELKGVLILSKLTVEAPLWVLPNVAPLRAEIIRHTVFHRGTYCEVLGQYSRRFFKETSKILNSNISSASSEEGMNIAPFSCHERIILDYYPSGSLRSSLSVFTTVEDIV